MAVGAQGQRAAGTRERGRTRGYPRASHLALARAAAGGTSSTRGGVPRAASSPASAAGWEARYLPTRVVPGRALRMAWAATLPVRAAREDATFLLPCPLPVAFPRNTPWFPEAGHGGCTRNATLPRPPVLRAALRFLSEPAWGGNAALVPGRTCAAYPARQARPASPPSLPSRPCLLAHLPSGRRGGFPNLLEL